jgi:hypothetical protein
MSNGTDNPNAHSVRQADDDREMARLDTNNREVERRHMDSEFRQHVLREIDQLKESHSVMNTKLDELLFILRGSRFMAGVIKYLAAVAVGFAAIWAMVHSGGAK